MSWSVVLCLKLMGLWLSGLKPQTKQLLKKKKYYLLCQNIMCSRNVIYRKLLLTKLTYFATYTKNVQYFKFYNFILFVSTKKLNFYWIFRQTVIVDTVILTYLVHNIFDNLTALFSVSHAMWTYLLLIFQLVTLKHHKKFCLAKEKWKREN